MNNKIVLGLMLLLMAAPAAAASFGDVASKLDYTQGTTSSNISYQIAEPMFLADGLLLQYTPRCDEVCYLPVLMKYEGALESSAKDIRSTDVDYTAIKLAGDDRIKSLEYYYLSFENYTQEIKQEVSCGKDVCLEDFNQTIEGYVMRELNTKVVEKSMPEVIVLKGIMNPTEKFASVDVIPEVWGYSMNELAAWNSSGCNENDLLTHPSSTQLSRNWPPTPMGFAFQVCVDGVTIGIQPYDATNCNTCGLWAADGQLVENQSVVAGWTNFTTELDGGVWYNITCFDLDQSSCTVRQSANGYYEPELYNSSDGCIQAGHGVFNNGGLPYWDAISYAIENITIIGCAAAAEPTNMDLFLNGSEANHTYTYGQVSNFTAVLNISAPVDVLVNGTIKDSGTATAAYVDTLGAGVYNVTANWTGNATHAASSASWNATVNKAAQPLVITNTTPMTGSYPYDVEVGGSGNLTPATLQVNGSIVANPYNTTLGAGVWNITYNASTNANYSANSTTVLLNVSKANDPLTLSNNVSWSISYPTAFLITGSSNDTASGLYMNASAISNPFSTPQKVGAYLFTYNTTGNANISANTTSNTLVIAQGTPSINVTFNDSSPAVIGVVINVTCDDNTEIGVDLYNDTHNISYAGAPALWDTTGLSAGTYNFTCNSSASENFTAGSDTESFTLTVSNSLVVDGVYDENNLSKALTFDIEVFNTTFSVSNTSLASFNDNSVSGNVTVVISAAGYGTRYYYIEIPPAGSINMTGYLVNTSEGHTVTFTVKDYYDRLIEGVNLTIQRLLPSWSTVSTVFTDSSGIATFFADDDANYKLLLSKSGYTSLERDQNLPLSAYDIYISEGIIDKPSYWDFYSTLYTNCTFSNASRVLNCTWVDVSGHVTNTSLEVLTWNSTGHTWTLCSNSSTNSSGSFYCSFGAMNNQTFVWSLLMSTSSTSSALPVEGSSWTDLVVPVILGSTGLLIATLLLLFSGFLGVQFGSPTTTVVFSILGILAATALNIIDFGAMSLTVMMGATLSGGILIWMMRGDKK